MRAPLLEVQHLTMRFGGLVAIDDLSFVADQREITAIIGPNGAGKTTVFNCLTGFYKPTVGQLTFHADGHELLLEQMEGFRIARAGVARTFQNIRLFGQMSVLENLVVAQHNALMRASGYTVLGVLGFAGYRHAEQAAVERARGWLDRIGLVERADWDAANLPYGEQRKLEIARAMCTQPKLLCLDEPAAGLNPRETAELGELLARDPRRVRRRRPADRARHERGHGHLGPHRRARLRPEDRRRHAGRDPHRRERDQGLSRRDRGGGAAARGRGRSRRRPACGPA